MEAYRDALDQDVDRDAPWYVVPADRKWVRNLAVARILRHTLERIDPRTPSPRTTSPASSSPDSIRGFHGTGGSADRRPGRKPSDRLSGVA